MGLVDDTRCVENLKMEYVDLVEKMAHLDAALADKSFPVSKEHRDLMKRQSSHMNGYACTLLARIRDLTEGKELDHD